MRNNMADYMESFSIKLKILRNSYDLSLAELAGLLSLNTRASLYDWENKRSFPAMENLISLANIFGISLEWLLGRSKDVYTEDSLRSGEIALYTQIDDDYIAGKEVGEVYRSSFLLEIERISHRHYLNLKDLNMTNYDSRIEYYVDHNWKKQSYSLPVRANLLVLLHLVPLEDLYWAGYYILNGKKKRGVLAYTKNRLLSMMGGPRADAYKEPGKKAQERAVNLVELLRLPRKSKEERALIKVPIYDVEGALRELEKEKLKNFHDEIQNLYTAEKDRKYDDFIAKKTHKVEI